MLIPMRAAISGIRIPDSPNHLERFSGAPTTPFPRRASNCARALNAVQALDRGPQPVVLLDGRVDARRRSPISSGRASGGVSLVPSGSRCAVTVDPTRSARARSWHRR